MKLSEQEFNDLIKQQGLFILEWAENTFKEYVKDTENNSYPYLEELNSQVKNNVAFYEPQLSELQLGILEVVLTDLVSEQRQVLVEDYLDYYDIPEGVYKYLTGYLEDTIPTNNLDIEDYYKLVDLLGATLTYY